MLHNVSALEGIGPCFDRLRELRSQRCVRDRLSGSSPSEEDHKCCRVSFIVRFFIRIAFFLIISPEQVSEHSEQIVWRDFNSWFDFVAQVDGRRGFELCYEEAHWTETKHLYIYESNCRELDRGGVWAAALCHCQAFNRWCLMAGTCTGK